MQNMGRQRMLVGRKRDLKGYWGKRYQATQRKEVSQEKKWRNSPILEAAFTT
jgi:hypothetical protein